MRAAVAFAALLLAAPVWSGPIRLIGPLTNGHACPVQGRVLTARHVIFDGSFVSFAWDHGFAFPVRISNMRDIGEVELDAEPQFYGLATGVDEGEKVHWFEYDQSDPFRHERKEAKVRTVTAGHIIFDKEVHPGGSGTCVLNENEEVVGIAVWAIPAGLKKFGGAVDVTGRWWPIEGEKFR